MKHKDGSPASVSRQTAPAALSTRRQSSKKQHSAPAFVRSHRDGMLELTLPLKDSVKPRRIQIDGVTNETKKQLTTA